jgi:hypothetical protein
MRRLLSFVLFAAFVLPMATPWLALAQNDIASLPLCCRRNGAHHCAMPAAEQAKQSSAPRLVARCPFYRGTVAVQPVGTRSALSPGASSATAPLLHLAAIAPHPLPRASQYDRSRSTRGPPASLLL